MKKKKKKKISNPNCKRWLSSPKITAHNQTQIAKEEEVGEGEEERRRTRRRRRRKREIKVFRKNK